RHAAAPPGSPDGVLRGGEPRRDPAPDGGGVPGGNHRPGRHRCEPPSARPAPLGHLPRLAPRRLAHHLPCQRGDRNARAVDRQQRQAHGRVARAVHGVQRIPHPGGALPAAHPGHHRGPSVPLPDRLPGGAAHPRAGPCLGAAAPARAMDLGRPLPARSSRPVAQGAPALRGLRRMTTVGRYWRLFRVQVRSSVLLGLQYRADFVLDGLVSLFWTLTALVPIFTVYHLRQSVAGWTFEEALLVTGWFTLLEAILEGAINPSLTAVVEHIRKGTLDFVLLKPADAQFLVSTARFEPWRSTNVVTALVLWVYSFVRMGRLPSPTGSLAALLLLVAATALLCSQWILTVSAAFYVVKIDNLTNLFNSIFDAARWPVEVFRGAIRWIFTFIVPLALMTTFPAQAMLGRLPLTALAWSVVGAGVFGWLSRRVWLSSIARYTSASS